MTLFRPFRQSPDAADFDRDERKFYPPHQPLIPRCKWCIARIGKPSYRVDGEWQTVFSVHHLLGDVNFSDGICPDCLTLEKAKILKQNHE